MFCTKCAAQVLDTDLFCPKCGQPIKHHAPDSAPQVDINDIPPRQPADEQIYTGYYSSVDEGKRSNVLRVLLFILLGLAVIFAVYSGVMMLNDKDPIDELGSIFTRDHTSDSDYELSASDDESASEIITATDATTDAEPVFEPETTTSSSTTASTTASTTRPTTTTTKPTTTATTASPEADKIRQTAVGSWKADISAIGIKVAGMQIKNITLDIDKSGNAKVGYKVGIIKGSTTGSFEVSGNGKTLLTIKVPVTGENVYMAGMSKVVDNNTIIFTLQNGQTVKLERTK